MFVFLLITSLVFQDNPDWNVNRKGVALDGYDLVSYFQDKPMEGTKENSLQYRGAIFYFSTQENLKTFKRNPAKYVPQYGGFCAFAMGDSGEKVDVDPETYKLLDGKLYLFYNSWGNNTLIPWNRNEGQLKQQADKNWKNFSSTDK